MSAPSNLESMTKAQLLEYGAGIEGLNGSLKKADIIAIIKGAK